MTKTAFSNVRNKEFDGWRAGGKGVYLTNFKMLNLNSGNYYLKLLVI